MKKFAAGVALGLVVSWAVSFAAPAFDHSGAFWNKLDAAAKEGYVNGYGDAMQVSVGKLSSLSIAADLFHWKGANKIIRQISHDLQVSELAPQDGVKQLDTLYSDRKYSELDVGSAIQMLSVRLPSDGASGSGAAVPTK